MVDMNAGEANWMELRLLYELQPRIRVLFVSLPRSRDTLSAEADGNKPATLWFQYYQIRANARRCCLRNTYT